MRKNSDRLIPERTIDSLLAIEVVRRDPYALIWSPTNSTGSIDHLTFSRRGATAFECKAVILSKPGGPWTLDINASQLRDYASLDIDVQYVFLIEPSTHPLERLGMTLPNPWPWVTSCSCTNSAVCVSCPTDERSKAQLQAPVRESFDLLRIQPWFGHWAWTATAKSLQKHLRSCTPNSSGEITVTAGSLLVVEGIDRLCHYLAGLSDGTSQQWPAVHMGEVFEDNFARARDGEEIKSDGSGVLVFVHGRDWG